MVEFDKEKAREEVLRRFAKFINDEDVQIRPDGKIVFKRGQRWRGMKRIALILEKMNEKRERNIFKIQRASAILNMRVEGSTLDEIGKAFGVSRERIRQILEKEFPERDFGRAKQKPKFPIITKKCPTCEKEMTRSGTRSFLAKIHCSRTCYMNDPNYNHLWKMTREEKRKYWNSRMKKYREKNKDTPAEKLRTWKGNQKYKLKKMLSDGKITEVAYNILYKKIGETRI